MSVPGGKADLVRSSADVDSKLASASVSLAFIAVRHYAARQDAQSKCDSEVIDFVVRKGTQT